MEGVLACMCTSCVPTKVRKEHQIPQNWSHRWCEHSCWCWELNLGFQQVLLIPEPTLQLPGFLAGSPPWTHKSPEEDSACLLTAIPLHAERCSAQSYGNYLLTEQIHSVRQSMEHNIWCRQLSLSPRGSEQARHGAAWEISISVLKWESRPHFIAWTANYIKVFTACAWHIVITPCPLVIIVSLVPLSAYCSPILNMIFLDQLFALTTTCSGFGIIYCKIISN